MNRQEKDILCTICKEGYINQRILAETSGYSLGAVNKALNNLIIKGYLDSDKCITEKAKTMFADTRPESAIILAAGFGMRMVPINTESPKGLLEVHGQPLIERIIKQLYEVDVKKIYIVVGFMKECYEYLIDEYGVELIVNTEYASKNNMHSLNMAKEYLGNTYIIPCDIWCEHNPFSTNELYSWYMVSEKLQRESNVKVNRKSELVIVSEQTMGNEMIGICYLLAKESLIVKERLEMLCEDLRYDDCFWEETLNISGKMLVSAKLVSSSEYMEINTYEQLREIDNNSQQLKSHVIILAANVLGVKEDEITNITVLKKGMTNRSFLFHCKEKKYIMRIPGEGADKLINRREEAAVYDVIRGREICDQIIYLNPENGYKITEYIENAQVCDASSTLDVEKCMDKLRTFHDLKLEVSHEFNLFEQIDFYESLWNNNKSIYRDYKKTKEKIFSLRNYIEEQKIEKILTHIDANPDNFLFYYDSDGKEKVRLIDWEYAGMQDPHVDIAMFAIYSLYDKEQLDELIRIYFKGDCSKPVKIKIYCYVAVCGLLWSNWCEYKRSLGVEFGEYSLRQYRYAKDFYKIVQTEIMEITENE